MCGICGITWNDDGLVRRMAAAGAHRGPDQDGHYSDASVSLGHRRLSIIDLSEGGRQPMVDAATGAVIVFNGEIYNYRALRAVLEAEGARFRTSSDTEVLLQGLVRRGPTFLRELRGIFAFALWRPDRRELLLARDHLGVKPLYLLQSARGLAFASELKQLLEVPGFAPVLDIDTLDSYLTFHYVPGTRTPLEGIRRLPPGTVATWRGGALEIERFWSLPSAAGAPPSEDELAELLSRTVKDQLVADVPVGAFLSGGVDSGLVTSLAQRHSPDALQTFSVGFDDEVEDELAAAAGTAAFLGTRHREVRVRGAEVAREFDRMTWAHDEPMAEAGSIPTYFVSRFARAHVKVVLAGEGGDEAFGGYRWYTSIERAQRLRRLLPAPVRRVGHALAMRLPGDLGRRARTVLDPGDAVDVYTRLVADRDEAALRRLRPRSSGAPPADALRKVDEARHGDAARWQRIDLATLLADCFLTKADRMTMAWGLEERVPLLDPDVVAAGLRLSASARRGGTDKGALRAVARRHLPAAVAARAKRGYGVPIAHWCRTDLWESVRATLADSRLVRAGHLDATEVETMARRPPETGADAAGVWTVFAMERWLRVFDVHVPEEKRP